MSINTESGSAADMLLQGLPALYGTFIDWMDRFKTIGIQVNDTISKVKSFDDLMEQLLSLIDLNNIPVYQNLKERVTYNTQMIFFR